MSCGRTSPSSLAKYCRRRAPRRRQCLPSTDLRIRRRKSLRNATINAAAVTTTSNSAGISELGLRDLLLHALTVSSGAVESISFLALGKVFSAFMTGNIAFLGLRIARAPAPGFVSILVSMAAFAVGVYVSTRIVRYESCGSWSQRVTVALGVSLIAHAIFLAVWFATS